MAQSLGRGLDPDFKIVPMLESSIMRIIKKRFSVTAALRRMPLAAAKLASLAGGLPERLDRMMKTAERGEMQVRADVSGVEQYIPHLKRIVYITVIGIIGAALILGVALYFAFAGG